MVNLVKSVLKVTSIIPGNDVCTTKEDPSEMTSEEQFLNNTLTALNFFETRLAPNSHVILVGLIDAGVNNWIKRSKSLSLLILLSSKYRAQGAQFSLADTHAFLKPSQLVTHAIAILP